MVAALLAPPLVVWGLYCAGVMIKGGIQAAEATSAEESLLRSFPFVMMVAAVMLIVTGRPRAHRGPAFVASGLAVAAAYVVIWMFNGKRSHALIGVFATVCASTLASKRPSWPVLLATAFAGALVVGIAIGWRNNADYELSFAGFRSTSREFELAKILESLNIERGGSRWTAISYETKEYGGFLLMMDTVPEKSDYDYGMNYIRIVSTYIPRIIWPTKPLFGRDAVGRRLDGRLRDGARRGLYRPGHRHPGGHPAQRGRPRHADRAGLRRPGAPHRLRVLPAPRRFALGPVLVGDHVLQRLVHGGRRRPLTWFYYNWGFSGFPIVVLMWWILKLKSPAPRGLESRPLEAHPAPGMTLDETPG